MPHDFSAEQQPMTTEELCNNVIEWAEQKGIFANATVFSQFSKTLEEVNEYYTATTRDEKIDAIGDVCVTLMILYFIIFKFHSDLPRRIGNDCIGDKECLSKKVGTMATHISLIETDDHKLLGVFIEMFSSLHHHAKRYDVTLAHCLACAYDEIKGRTGRMVGGVFVKDDA